VAFLETPNELTNQERTPSMPHYVDGFLLPVPKDQIDLYRQIAEEAGKIWPEHGALEYCECVGDDLDVRDQVPFPRIVETKPDETVVFAWIVFESREHRDQVNAKVMADPRMASMARKARCLSISSAWPTAGSRPLSKSEGRQTRSVVEPRPIRLRRRLDGEP
jgi:uncharacterized protein YbaA (DUF1428 family)